MSGDARKKVLLPINLAPRATLEQEIELYDFMEQNLNFARGRLRGLMGRTLSHRLWNEIVARLHKLGGAKKTVAQWRKYWHDKKSKIKIQLTELRNNGEDLEVLTPLQSKLATIMGLIGDCNHGLAQQPDSQDEQLLEEDEYQTETKASIVWEDNAINLDLVPKSMLEMNNVLPIGTSSQPHLRVRNKTLLLKERTSTNLDYNGHITRPSSVQVGELVEFMMKHQAISQPPRYGYPLRRHRQLWWTIAHRLNQMEGARMTVKQWRKYWDVRTRKLSKGETNTMQSSPDGDDYFVFSNNADTTASPTLLIEPLRPSKDEHSNVRLSNTVMMEERLLRLEEARVHGDQQLLRTVSSIVGILNNIHIKLENILNKLSDIPTPSNP